MQVKGEVRTGALYNTTLCGCSLQTSTGQTVSPLCLYRAILTTCVSIYSKFSESGAPIYILDTLTLLLCILNVTALNGFGTYTYQRHNTKNEL